RLTDRRHMLVEAFLVAFGEVRRQDECPFGPDRLGVLDVANRLNRRPCRRGEYGNLGAGVGDCELDDASSLGGGEAEPLPCAAGGEQPGHVETRLPSEVVSITIFVDFKVGIERGGGIRQQSIFEVGRQIRGRKLCHRDVLHKFADNGTDSTNASLCMSKLSDAFVESRSEEHTSELQSRFDLVCRLLLEKKSICSNGYAGE